MALQVTNGTWSLNVYNASGPTTYKMKVSSASTAGFNYEVDKAVPQSATEGQSDNSVSMTLPNGTVLTGTVKSATQMGNTKTPDNQSGTTWTADWESTTTENSD